MILALKSNSIDTGDIAEHEFTRKSLYAKIKNKETK